MLRVYRSSSRNYLRVTEPTEPSETKRNILSKQWIYVLPTTLSVYFILQCALGYQNQIYGVRMQCTDQHIFPSWIKIINALMVLWFILSAGFIVSRMLLKAWGVNKEWIGAYAANLTITVIAGSSSFLTLSCNWGGLCRDAFGVLSPASQWPEWLTSVPLLLYLTVACDVKDNLEFKDIAIVALMWGAIFCGLGLHFGLSNYVNVTLLSASCACVLSVFYLAADAQTDLNILISGYFGQRRSQSELNADQRLIQLSNKVTQLEAALKKKSIALVCLVGMPLFPLIYFLTMLHLINDDNAYAATMIASMVVKSIIATIVSEGHVSGFEDIDFFVARGVLDRDLEEAKQNCDFAHNRFYKVNFNAKSHSQPSKVECEVVQQYHVIVVDDISGLDDM